MSISNRLEKHFAVCAAAVATVACVGTANAAIVTWNANLVIPNNIDGQYINVETQTAGSAAGNVAGWDLNPYGTSTTAMSWFAAAAPSGCVMGLGQGGTTVAVASLSGETLVGSASTFGNTASSVTAGGWKLNQANYFGFRFLGADGLTHYGWGIMTVGATMGVRTLTSVTIETTAGASINLWGGPLDTDGDGVPDFSDNCSLIANPTQANNDGDSQGDVCDADDDNDGVLDTVDNCSLIANSNQLNADGDSQGDACDADDDNDGLLDPVDNCPTIANSTQANNDGDSQGDVCDADDDNDGVLDTVDNCSLIANPNQLNADGDSQGDACDADDDNDGLLDPVDNCPTIANSNQLNTDGDSEGDVCDADDDNDGVLDTVDNCSLIANPTQANNDGDSQGDVCDADDDNDGVLDTVDNCPTIANPTQTDCNTNGVGDVCETGFLDCNSDGVPDTCQGAIFFTSSSPNLGAPSGLQVRSFAFTQLNFSESGVQLTIDVSGDLNGVNEWIDVSLNGDLPRRFFEAGGNDCPATPDRAVIDLTREQFSALIGSTGSLIVSVSCPATVDPTECKGAGLTTIGISYVGINPTSGDCDGDRRLDVCAVAQGAVPDCNSNRVPDSCDIASGFVQDCNANGIPDACDIASTFAKDCNANGIPDSCDIATASANDCNINGIPDSCDIATAFAIDCNINGIPDTCDIATGVAKDCNVNGIPDTCDIATGVAKDCNVNGIPDTCDIAAAFAIDCNLNGIPDTCDIATGFAKDCNINGIPDSCDIATAFAIDCNLNGIPDTCDIATAFAIDCNLNGIPDSCDIATAFAIDCNLNGIPDTCDIATGFAKDCNLNTIPDSCDIATAFAKDCDLNTVPDSCDIASGIAKDCNLNGIPDSCDIASTFAKDCNANTIPDSCDIASGISFDIDGNAKPDECQTTSLTSGGNIQGAINSASASELRIVTLGAGTYSGPISITDKAIIIRGAGAANTIIQGTGGASSSVLKMENNPAISLIEGVTIRGGLTGTLYPNSPPQNLVGGGIFMLNSAGSIRNCIIESNFAGYGGGAYVFGCTGTISNCIFRNNNVSADGGGIQLSGGAPKVVDTVVESNFANGRGAGMHVVQGAPELLRVNIRNNVSNNIVGGLSWYGLLSPSAFLKVTSCQVTSNSALVVQGGIGISSPSQANISILDSVVCGNVPQPNISGVWENLGGNTVCKCTGDIVVNGSIDGSDLAVLISQLQTSGGEPSADLDESGFVDGIDLAMLLSGWGACPSNGSITSITPAFGPTSGGTAITITGIGFGNMTSVKFGGIAATNVVATPTTVTAVTPARTAGVVDVAVSGPSQYVVATSAFTYNSAVVPPWATLLESTPDPTVVTDANLRAAIVASGFAWRIKDTSSNIEMLLVPGGTFMMGCSAPTQNGCSSNESPTHQVTLTQSFYMGRYEVTQAQWTAKMGSNPSSFSGYSDSPSRPVEQVSWNMIQGFNTLTGLRLPTEAEWEYAYRAGTTTAFHSYPAQPTGFNDDTLLGNIAWYSSNSGGQTHAVGGKLANGLGLHDMSGNVWEWCQDWYGPYSSVSVTNPTGPETGSSRLLRGGDWDFISSYCRGSRRGTGYPSGADLGIGFRAVRAP